jgi:septal ring factor EnvC (AmiA/AmiB activator)
LISARDRATVTALTLETDMSNQSLNDHIRTLTTELKQTTTMEAQTSGLLHDLQHEITRLTEHHDASVTERLEAIAVRFEADHPAVGTALRQAIDALSRAGI